MFRQLVGELLLADDRSIADPITSRKSVDRRDCHELLNRGGCQSALH